MKENLCNVKSNKTIPCDGEYVSSEGCCLRHAVLFDIWICEHDGFTIYRSKRSKKWKRMQFHKWLDTLTVEQAEKRMHS